MSAAAYEAWTNQLIDWQPDRRAARDEPVFTPAHPGMPIAAQAVRELLGAINEAQAAELITLFAGAFQLNETEAVTLLAPPIEQVEEPAAQPEPEMPIRAGSVIDRYVHWLQDQESPAAYHAFSFLTSISAAFRRRGAFTIGGIRLYPNLYTILLGPTGARKDSAFDYAVDLVNEAAGLHVLASEGSQQGFATLLQERYGATGTSDGLIPAPELKVLFGGDKYKEDLVVWLTEWFKCQPYWARVVQKYGKIELHNLYICLLAGTTVEWLRTMPADVLTGGFLTARAILVPAADKKHWRFLPVIDVHERDRLVDHVRQALTDVPDMLTLQPAAERFMTDWYEGELPKRFKVADERGRAFLQRVHIHAIKFATIFSVLESGSATITLRSAEDAVALAMWCGERIAPFVANLETREPIYDDILTALRKRGGNGTAREIVRWLRNRYAAEKIRSALAQLDYAQELRKANVGGEEAYAIRRETKRG